MPADQKEGLNHEVAAVNSALERGFASHRDIIISDSSQTGKVSVSLWASGRVTEDVSRDTPEMYHGFAVFTYDHREILPPYDFLTSK